MLNEASYLAALKTVRALGKKPLQGSCMWWLLCFVVKSSCGPVLLQALLAVTGGAHLQPGTEPIFFPATLPLKGLG